MGVGFLILVKSERLILSFLLSGALIFDIDKMRDRKSKSGLD